MWGDGRGTEGTWLQHVRSCALHLLQWFLISEAEAEVKSKSDRAIGSPKLKAKANKSRLMVNHN